MFSPEHYIMNWFSSQSKKLDQIVARFSWGNIVLLLSIPTRKLRNCLQITVLSTFSLSHYCSWRFFFFSPSHKETWTLLLVIITFSPPPILLTKQKWNRVLNTVNASRCVQLDALTVNEITITKQYFLGNMRGRGVGGRLPCFFQSLNWR